MHDLIIACCVSVRACVCLVVCVFVFFLDKTQLKECKWSFFLIFEALVYDDHFSVPFFFFFSPPLAAIGCFLFLPDFPLSVDISRRKNCELPHL